MNQNPTGQQSSENDATEGVATIATSTSFLRPPNKRQISIANFIHKPIPLSKSKMIDQQLVKMIVKEYHPFSVVENVEFRNLIKMLCPTYVIPSRKTISQSLMPQMFEMTVERVKDTLKNVEAVCLTTDGWTSKTNQSFISVTAHFIDPKNETLISSVLLGCIDFDEKHTSDNLARFLRNLVEEWNLSNKLTAIITDNAANIKAAIRKCNWRWLSCFAHSINLTVQSSLDCIDSTLSKVKSIVQYFKKSSHALAKLNDYQKRTSSPILKLKQDCPTRWNSTYEMINRIIAIKDPIIATLAVLGNPELNCLNPQDWIILENARDILKIFYEVTVEISAEKYVTLSKEIIFIKTLNKFVLNFNNNTLPREIHSMCQVLKDELLARFGNIEENQLITQATLLDPRFKKFAFSNENHCKKAVNLLKAKAQSIILEPDEPIHQQVTTLTSTSDSSSALWKEFDETVVNLIGGSNSSVAGIIEVEKYLNEPLISRAENPLVWWAERKKVYPRLYILVKRRLCIIATSVPCERIFSKAGQVVTEKRSQLSTSKISQILFLNHNM